MRAVQCIHDTFNNMLPYFGFKMLINCGIKRKVYTLCEQPLYMEKPTTVWNIV